MKRIVTIHDTLTEHQVGGKFVKQSIMTKQGCDVPPFFCLTREFYEECASGIIPQIKEILSEIDFNNHPSIRHNSSKIRDLFVHLTITPNLESSILKAFDGMHGNEAIVSVRASTVSKRLGQSEDSESNAFAGMSESFLYVKREQLMDKIRLCWASGFSTESLIYKQIQGFDLLDFGVAVGIQQMIFGEKSFVMFSCHPQTAAKDVIIAGAYGIGEGVVQEAVPVDHFTVQMIDGTITTDIVVKNEKLSFDGEKGFGVRKEVVSERLQNLPCFSKEEIDQLVEYSQKIEKIFGIPQDIEGTFDMDGKIWILQSRPIVFNFDRQLIWTNANVTESFPGVTTALTYSFSRFFYRVIFYDVYVILGVKNEVINDNFDKLDRMIGFIKGRIYYCLTHFYLLHKQTPLFPLMKKDWERMMGFSASYHTPEKSLKALYQKVVSTWFFIVAVFKNLGGLINHNRKILLFHHWWEDVIAPLRGKDFSQADPLETKILFYKVWRAVGKKWGITLMNDSYLPIVNGITTRLFQKWGLAVKHPGLMSDLLCYGGRLRSVDIMLSAVALGEYVRKDEQLSLLFRSEDDAEKIWQMIREGKVNDDFTKKFNYHLHFYGDRGLQELKMEQPALRDTPAELVKMVKQYALQNISEDEVRDNERRVREVAEVILKKELKGSPLKRFVLRAMLGWLRDLIRNRENSRYCRSELFGFSKNVFKGIGSYLVSAGVVRELDDVYHLTMDEIFGYVDGTGVTENLQAIADIRRKEFEENKKFTTAEQFTTMGPLRQNSFTTMEEKEAFGNDQLKGLPSASGKVVGIARVIENPYQVEKIESHEILIAKETDPGWLFLMISARGIIAEKGSTLSHTAITGRKFNIPTIVSVKNVTKRIPDGALIEMDGGTGIVRILQEKAEIASVRATTEEIPAKIEQVLEINRS